MHSPESTKTVTPRLALTREEAGAALGVHANTVDNLAKRGLLRPSRATRRPLYPVWEIERFLRETLAVIPLRKEGSGHV